jgi:DNA-binding MarR family transcriptional regulator/N-acetylglutamate synthase-like GNAT family acetyltransferase
MEGDVGKAERIRAVRRFNRFYTQRIGVLRDGLLGSPFTLTQVRVLYELAHREAPSASDLARDLGLDAGYLSRILRGFGKQGLVRRTPSRTDGRRSHLALTPRGRAAFAPLERRSQAEVGSMLGPLSPAGQQHLVDAMESIQKLLSPPVAATASYVLRPLRAGDLGWVVHRHGAVYAEEWGYDWTFEALVAGIVAEYVKSFDPARERAWIADKDGAPVGSVFLVRKSATVAKLRLLLVEPAARGLGIGRRLVEECVAFARGAGYRKITLWTQKPLKAARAIYRQAGFRLVHEAAHRSFGQDLVAETWELSLRPEPAS